MKKLFIEDLEIKGKKVLMRVDFNVPLDGDQNVVDATRIVASIPSIQYVLDHGGALILMSHLGRPKNGYDPELSLAPVAKVLAGIIERPVQMAPDCIGSQVESQVERLKPGEVLLLENLRFHRAEEYPEEDPFFAKQLASYGDCYVNDAFGTAHRKHSSTYTLAKLFPQKAAAGYLLEKEVRFLSQALENPKKPFYAIIGGAKISTKLGVIKSLLKKVDKLFIGGGMAYTFLKARGFKIGRSIVEENLVADAKKLDSKKIILPIDVVAATECSEQAKGRVFAIEEGIPDTYEGLDIGPKTVALFSRELKDAGTILWNGPVGVYEFDAFAKGTLALSNAVVSTQAVTIVGGGDLIAALQDSENLEKMNHISTGGGATLEFIEFGTLPGIEALSNK